MAEAKEILLRILEAEEQAKKKVDDAKEKAEITLANAEKEAEKNYRQWIDDFKQEMENKKKAAMEEGEEAAAAIINTGKKRAASIRNMNPHQLDEAVEWMVERIVGRNGNR